ncbi:phage tail tip fiber protein [Aeromonas hydrophila]|uniref:phage tail tip fiber protein n=1 Tax=Aeromonas hydrophila TaxID=644 RepID=UPI00235FDC52|nr:fibronectin type III domain-containing protein [Aeromonas hydrophila]
MAVSAATAAYIAMATSVAAAAVSVAMMMSAKGKNNGDISDSGTSITRKGKDDPKIVPLGRSIVPATKVFTNVNDNNRRWLTEIFSLGHGPLKSINQIYIDEQPLFGVADQDRSEQWFNSSVFKEGFWNLQLGVRRGLKRNATWDPMVTHGDGLWTYDHRGDATSTISMLIERPDPKNSGSDKHRILSDKFQVEALVEGIKVIDPRVDPQLTGWNDSDNRHWVVNGKESYRNPALCLLTYLADQEFGFGIDPKFIDLNSFINTANWADSNKITMDGFVDQGDTFGNIVKQFVASFNGYLFLENGRIKIMPDTVSPVMFNVTEDDMHKDITISNNKGDYFNTVKVNFQNRDTEYNKDMLVLPKDALTDPTIKEDGRIFEKTIDCTLSTDPAYAKLVANMELKRAKLCRRGAVLHLNNLNLPLKVGYVFTIEHALYELDKNTKWRITSIENSLDKDTLISKIEAEEYNERVYDTTSYDDGNLSGSLPRPDFTILPVTNLKFTQNASNTVGSGMLSFDPQYMGDARFVVQYKQSTSNDWSQYGEFPFSNISMVNLITGVEYDYRVQTRAPIGASAWTTISNQKVNRVINLPAVKNLKADFTSADCVITFDPITGAIPNTTVVGDGIDDMSQLVQHYKVDVQHNTGTSRSYYTNTGRFVYTYDTNAKNGLERRLNITVTPVSLYGDNGDSASVSAYNSPMNQASGVSVLSELITFTVSWTNRSSQVSDYSHTNVYIKPTQTEDLNVSAHYVGQSSTGSFTKNVTQKDGWVVVEDVDVFGSAIPAITSAPIYYKTSNIDDMLGESHWQEDQDAKFAKLHTLAVDSNGNTEGMQIGVKGEPGSSQTSYVSFKVNTFQIENPDASKAPVFAVQNGKTVMRNAYIQDLTARNIRAGAITGNEINASSVIRAGSGTTSATLDGSNPSWRLYAGHTNPDWAPFRVDTTGKTYIDNAVVRGAITATSGSFTGNITAQSGSFESAVYCGSNNTAYVSGHPQHNYLQGPDGRFVVDRAGNMTCQFATIQGGDLRGNVYVERLIGDVYRKGYYRHPIIDGHFVSGNYNQPIMLNRINMGVQAFEQLLTMSMIHFPITMSDSNGKMELYYQLDGQPAVWIANAEGPNARFQSLMNWQIRVPTNVGGIQFFVRTSARTFVDRNKATVDSLGQSNYETMKWETIPFSYT